MVDTNCALVIMKKNISVAQLAFKADDLQLTNIIGNRIMSDAMFLDAREFALIGHFTKNMALSFINMKPRTPKTDYMGAILVGEKYLETLFEQCEHVNITQLWNEFHEFNIQVVRFQGSSLEKQVHEIYGTELQFTELVRNWLIDFLMTQRDAIYDSSNALIKGVMNEYQRVGLLYGYEVKDTIVYSLLLSLQRYFDYFRIQYSDLDKTLDRQAVSRIIFPYIDAIKRISSTDPVPYDDSTSLLWELIKGWREYFIKYQEQSQVGVEKAVELSKESRAKLSEMLGKALQKEVQP